MAEREGMSKLSIMDVACGGGDVAIQVAQQLQHPSPGTGPAIEVELTLLDRSATALRLAEAGANKAGLAYRCIEADLLAEASIPGVDVVMCSLFLHHLQQADQVPRLLANMRSWSRKLVVISDLRRSRLGYLVAWTGCRLLSRSPIVHFDGPVSVRAAWTLPELSTFAAQSRMEGRSYKSGMAVSHAVALGATAEGQSG